MAGLVGLLGLPSEPPYSIRYQLLHRTASALIEARRFHAQTAVLLVHSFSKTGAWHAKLAEALVERKAAQQKLAELNERLQRVEYRELDTAIQSANWAVELAEA